MASSLGCDLALTRYVGTASGVPLDSADSWGTLDLAVGASERTRRGTVPASADLARVAGRENLGQALMLRLLTAQGDLAPLGHPEFGSRLVELIGARNDEAARNRARLYTLQALALEPRVREVVDLAVTPVPGQPDTIRIDVSVLPIADAEPLGISLEVGL